MNICDKAGSKGAPTDTGKFQTMRKKTRKELKGQRPAFLGRPTINEHIGQMRLTTDVSKTESHFP